MLLIGGGIGNVYDCILFGSVTDFLHLDFGIFRTGIFNFARRFYHDRHSSLYLSNPKRKNN